MGALALASEQGTTDGQATGAAEGPVGRAPRDDAAEPTGIEAAFAGAMARLLGGTTPPALGVAVSGGGDSTALMHLAAAWTGGRVRLHAVTVDHGLREGSAEEAAAVGRGAAALGLDHAVLRWRSPGTGNLQAAARAGRRELIRRWAHAHGVSAVLLGHTLDDRAETLVMRLARGSGVEGLSDMEERAPDPPGGGFAFLRPLLDLRREDLRDWLRARGVAWAEDPSNEDPRFDRARARQAIGALGLDPRRLAATARRMARARHALELRALETARAIRQPALLGDVRLDRGGLLATDEDTRLRILAGALCCVAGAIYRPREVELERIAALVRDGGTRTLHGCVVRADAGALLIHREPAAVAWLRAPPGEPWDGAWHLSGPGGCEVRALGESGLRWIGAAAPAPNGGQAPADAWGLRVAPSGYPRASLAAKPALWRGDRLEGFAFARFGVHHEAVFRPRGGPFPDCLLTRPPPAA